MLDIRGTIASKSPEFFERIPKLLSDFAVFGLRKLLREKQINDFLRNNYDNDGIEFIDSVFDNLSFSYKTANKAKSNIPAKGRLVIVSNHPLGALDGLALIKLISEVRSDVKIVANDLLMSIDNLKQLMLPLDITTKASYVRDIKGILDALSRDEAIILFPAGEVSRARPVGIRDGKWEAGFLFLAEKSGAPVLPVFIKGKNSFLFYAASLIYKPLATLLLSHEMFSKRGKSIEMVVGDMIPAANLRSLKMQKELIVKLVRKHLYMIGRGQKGVLTTEKNVAHPEDRKVIRDELSNCDILGETADEKTIYLYDHQKKSALLKEIGRLREETFRKVGEGTGERRDIDDYDKYYRHLVLWDDKELDIVGAYRIAQGGEIYDIQGSRGFYSGSLFRFAPSFESYLPHSIELGRSFVQSKYWGSRALDYLWHGIGAYLSKNPQVRYMFGPVSIPGNYPEYAKKLLVYFYGRFFGSQEALAVSNNPFGPTKAEKEEFAQIFNALSYQENFRILKEQLRALGVVVPVLYKQYSELCSEGGVKFLDFGVDAAFGDCLDGLILVDVEKILPAKRERYMPQPIWQKEIG